jgi:metallo-beta-lactamase family protein
MLPDSAHIRNQEVSNFNRRARRRSGAAVTSIYDQDDVRQCLSQLRPAAYGVWIDVAPGVRARLWNAGDMLGSGSVELETEADGDPLRLVFSGDIGPNGKLPHLDPEGPSGVDHAICESTYGDERRPPVTDAGRRLAPGEMVKRAFHLNAVLIIPSFAVERAQELLSDLAQLIAEGALPRIPIFVDSPMASRATDVFADHIDDLDGTVALARALHSTRVHFTKLVAASMALEQHEGFHLIIAASGRCEAGRISHHLKNWLWRREATVLFLGFQAAGTLGRILQGGAPTVRIQGEEFTVNAKIRSIDMYSGHADEPQPGAWLRARGPIAKGVLLVHGEEAALAGLAARLEGTGRR